MNIKNYFIQIYRTAIIFDFKNILSNITFLYMNEKICHWNTYQKY